MFLSNGRRANEEIQSQMIVIVIKPDYFLMKLPDYGVQKQYCS